MRYALRESGTDSEPPASAAVRASPLWWNPFNRLRWPAANEEIMKPLIRIVGLASAAVFAAACASVGGGGGGTDTNGGVGPGTGQVVSPSIIWPVKTREHVDLWLHGYALLQEDTT